MSASLIEVIAGQKETLEMFRYLVNGSYLRVVNYHNTLKKDEDQFRREIEAFSKNYVSVTIPMLDEFFATRKWPAEKPGLIPAVFEGWRTHFDVYAKVLDEYGFRGWFYLPAFYPDVPEEEQISYCVPHSLRLRGHEEVYGSDPRCCMTWDEVRELSKNHEICCHTGSHARVTETSTDEELRREIIESKAHMEEKIGKEVSVFCWLGGDEYQKMQFAHPYFEEAGYKYVVSNLKLEKIR